MKVNSTYLSQNLQQGVRTLEKYGFIQTDNEGLLLKAIQDKNLIIEKTETTITITYDIEQHFYMALARSMVMSTGTHCIAAKAKRLGFMVDCSRNAVAKPETVKQLICMLVMAGYDYMELYTEETYELPDEPYFGYKRGRYSAEELKEIVAFADIFQLEMVPCMQTLAHLSRLANWMPYYDFMDIDDILLVNDERTYQLIRKCVRFWKEICHTTRINVGSDEARLLGRGKYTDRYGYKNSHEIYLEHMKKVFDICKEEGMKPEFWADAFYNMDRPEEEMRAIFDGDQLPIVWKYRDSDAPLAEENLKKMKKYAGKTMFAGGLWKWQGYAPDNGYTQRSLDALLGAAQNAEVDDILMTAWGDDGNECSVHAIIPSMWYAAHKLYPCDINLSEMILITTGYTKEEWELCDKLNYVMPQLDKQSNAAKYILYNDFLVGLLDYNIPDHAGEIYKELLPQFTTLAEKESRFSYLFASYEALCRVLKRKATFGRRLYRAYQDKDNGTIRDMVLEAREIGQDLKEFLIIYREQWTKENKGFGFEVIDLRIGGLIARTETVSSVLNDYLDGKTERIYELEEARLEYWNDRLTGDEVYAPVHPLWGTIYTVNIAY